MQHQLFPGPVKSDDEMGQMVERGWIFLTGQVVQNEEHKGRRGDGDEEKSLSCLRTEKSFESKMLRRTLLHIHFN